MEDKEFAYLDGDLCAICRECGDRYEWDYLQDASQKDIEEIFGHQGCAYCLCCDALLWDAHAGQALLIGPYG